MKKLNDAQETASVSAYIRKFPKEVAEKLESLRQVLKKTAPQAEEIISYQMPAYKFHGILVYFAGYRNHIGFYPGAKAIEVFSQDLLSFKTSKGTIQFPLDQPLPLTLVKKITRYRISENLEKLRQKTPKKAIKKA